MIRTAPVKSMAKASVALHSAFVSALHLGATPREAKTAARHAVAMFRLGESLGGAISKALACAQEQRIANRCKG